MKRFTFAAMFSVSIFAVWMIFLGPSLSPSKTNGGNPPAQSQDVIDEMPNNSRNWMVAPVFDASGALISNPSGLKVSASPSENRKQPITGAERMVAPVFDASGAVISNPSGIQLHANISDRKIAPVFDASGAVVSDPSGTVLNSSNP